MIKGVALARIKDCFAAYIAAAEYVVGGNVHPAVLNSSSVNDRGEIIVRVTIDMSTLGTATITKIRLRDWNGRVWVEEDVSITADGESESLEYQWVLTIGEAED